MSENPLDALLPEDKLEATDASRAYIMIDLSLIDPATNDYGVSVATDGINQENVLFVLEALVESMRADKLLSDNQA